MRRAALATVAGLVLATGAPAGWLLSQTDGGQFGRAAAQELRAAAASEDVPAGPAPAAAAPAPRVGPVGTRSARLTDVVAPRDPPVAVRLAGRTAPVDAVGLDSDRSVVVPDDVRRAGWYAAGPQPGDRTGAAVLVGHADSAAQGLGTFAGLRDLAAGDEVGIRTASGRDLVYEVVSFERFAKAEVPMTRLFARDGASRLVLISCGGEFDPVRRTYADNVVVTAVPRA